MRRKFLVSLLGLALVFLAVAPRAVKACPMCSEAAPITGTSEAEDQARLGRGYNNSIYLMAGMPYLCLGTVGFLIYRRFRLHGSDQ
jgi:hypothetical protein